MNAAHDHRLSPFPHRLAILVAAAGVVVIALLTGVAVQPTPTIVRRIAIDSSASPWESSALRDFGLHDPGYAGSWVDEVGTLQVRLVKGASSTRAREAVGNIRATVVADRDHTYGELTAAMAKVDSASFTADAGIVSLYVDEQRNRLVATALPTRTADARLALERAVGRGVAEVDSGQSSASLADPDRFRDRSPYTGASAISLGPGRTGSTRKRCSTSFPLQRRSDGKSFVLTAAHCTEAWEGAWTGSGYSPNSPFQANPYAFTSSTASLRVWANYIGTNVGYADSVCPSNTPSHRLFTCGVGGATYSTSQYNTSEYSIVGGFAGDVAIVRVARVEPYIWVSRRSKASVYYAQTSDPIVGDSGLCFSGQTTGTWCGLTVRAVNVSAWSCSNTACATNPTNDNRHYVQGRAMATKSSGQCTAAGDSGGAIYKPARTPSGRPGAVRAIGVHNGSSRANYCTVFFTPVWRAATLFSAPVVHR